MDTWHPNNSGPKSICFPHPSPILLPLFIIWGPFFLLHLFVHFTCYGLYQRIKETGGEVGIYDFAVSCFRKMKWGGRGGDLKPMSKLTPLTISGINLSGSTLFVSQLQRQVLRNGYRGTLEIQKGNTVSPSPSFITIWSSSLIINNWGLILQIQRDSHYPKQ